MTMQPISDPAHDVLPRGVQGGVDVTGGDLHAPREHRLQDLPWPCGDRWHQEVSRYDKSHMSDCSCPSVQSL